MTLSLLNSEHVDPMYKELERNNVDMELTRDGEEIIGVEDNKTSTWDMLRGFKAKLHFFDEYTYAGWPALASEEFGEQSLETLAELSAEPLSQVYMGTLPPKKWHSPLWKTRWVLTIRWIGWLFEKIVGRKPNPTW